MKESYSRRIFEYCNIILLAILGLVMFLPYLKIISETFSSANAVDTGKVFFWPIGFTLDNYKVVLQDASILNAFYNSVFVTVTGTFINLVLTAMLAYALSRPEFLFKKSILLMIVITMIFTPPMIPRYLLVRQLGMLDTFWALLLPGAISTFNFFVLKSFFQGIPGELIDSARIDGCSEMRVLIQIVTPISKASLATVGLFYAVTHWNALFGPLMYIRKPSLFTLQVRLNQILQTVNIEGHDNNIGMMSQTSIRMTTILVATVPILILYPFLQKYFVKGATLGSLKE